MSAVMLLVLGCRPEPLDDSLLPEDVVELSMFDPAPASMVPAGDTTLRGEAKGLTDVRVNGEPVDLDGNLWELGSTLSRGINRFEVSGRDGRGDLVYLRQSVLAGDFGPADTETLPAVVGIRANQGALDAATGLVGDLLDAAQINSLLPSLNPVYQDSYGLFGLDAVTISADIGSLWFAPPEITLEPGAGALEIEVVLPDVSVLVPVQGDVIGIDFDADLVLTSTRAVISGFLELGAARDGSLTANLVAPRIELQGFFFDTSILPGSVEDWLLSDTVRGIVEDLLNEQISALVPDLLAEQLAGLQIALETELLGKPLSIGAGFDTISIDRDGVLLVASVDLDIPGPYPKKSSGYLLSGAGEPRPDKNIDLSVLLSDDLVNKLLHDFWRSGVIDLSLSTADGSLDAFMLAPLGAKNEGSISIDAGLPPVLVQRGSEPVLQFGELTVRIETPGGENGNFLVVTLAGEVPIDLELQGGALTLDLGEPDLALMVRDNDWGGENETVTALLEHELPIDLLLSLIGDIEIPVPAIGDIVIPDAAVGRHPSGAFTTIGMDL